MIIFENSFKKILLAGIVLTFILLLFKNPFSERNLIPNLEPFPDSIHYLNPPLSFLNGRSFVIEREGGTIRPAVPFLYSATLIPGFLINRDVRFFYVTNVILAFLGLLFFYKSLEKVLQNAYVTLLILFLYITNYFIYWYPNLPMAENLILTLYLIGLYLLVCQLTVRNAFMAGLIAISFYATKYASSSLSLTYLFLYTCKILPELIYDLKKFTLDSFRKNPAKFISQKKTFSILMSYILGTGLSLLVFFAADSLIRGNNIFLQLLEHAGTLAASKGPSGIASQSGGWFSFGYFKEHLLMYLNAISGSPMRFLWDYTPLVPKYIAIPALLGILVSLIYENKKFLGLSLLLFIVIPTVAISPFYSTDARYIYHVIPTILIGFGLFLILLNDFLIRYKFKKVFFIFLAGLFIFYSGSNFQRLKYQIALNLKHSETPWHYMSVKNFNDYFQTPPTEPKDKPILITALQPFYIDFFSNSNYQLLPLSGGQEFIKRAETVWGPNDYSDLVKLYKKYLLKGRTLYITNAALGSEGFLYSSFNSIKEAFFLEEVKKGCFETCNIYKISPKR